jgi:hypothetical protein
MVKNIYMKNYNFTKSYYCNNCSNFFLVKNFLIYHYEITTEDGKTISGIDKLFCPNCGSFNIEFVKVEDKCVKD